MKDFRISCLIMYGSVTRPVKIWALKLPNPCQWKYEELPKLEDEELPEWEYEELPNKKMRNNQSTWEDQELPK